jgi:hypothetical protein
MGSPGGIVNFELATFDGMPVTGPGFNQQQRYGMQLVQLPPQVVNTIVQVTTQTATFVLRGFYAGSGQYEFWSGTSRNTPNPSGHPLTDITVVAELVGTGVF